MKNKIHNHPGMESNLKLDKDHVIIDTADFEKANKAIEIVNKMANLNLGLIAGSMDDLESLISLISTARKVINN